MLLNNIFAAAFDELRRNHGIKTQKELARRMGVSEDTITRVMKGRTDVTEDIITKLQTASGCIFNLQWLRGKDPFHMLAVDAENAIQNKKEIAPCTASTSISQPEKNIIDLATDLIVELEQLRRQTQNELALLVQARQSFDSATQELQKLIQSTHTKHPIDYFPNIAAEDTENK